MRKTFNARMAALDGVLVRMCELAGISVERSTRALLDSDLALAETVIADQVHIVRLSAEAEELAFALLALQAPVASDLRSIVGGFRIIADIDRMGALAVHISKLTRIRHPASVVPNEISGFFAEMGRLAVQMSTDARVVLQNKEPRDAMRLQDDDDAMDDLHRHVFTILMDPQWGHGAASAVDVTLLSRYYERFADHAVLIGRRVVFQATGRTPEQYGI